MQNSPICMILYLLGGIPGLISFLNCACLIALRCSTSSNQISAGCWHESCPFFSVCHHSLAPFVCRVPQRTCCHHHPLRLLCASSSGAFVHGQPSLFLLASLSSLMWPTSRPATQRATVALQDLQVCGRSGRYFKDSSSLNNCCFKRLQL